MGELQPEAGAIETVETTSVQRPLHPALASVCACRGSGLPAALTSFIGRERERAAVLAQLRREDVRLLTLTGPGGIGKTRLAIEAAAALESEYQDGVCFVPLVTLCDPQLVLPAIARALGVREAAGRPLLEGVVEFLARRRALLVLDNFEQLLPAAPLLVHLLSACPDLRILATSRAALGVQGEHNHIVPPLENAAALSLLGLPGPDKPAARNALWRSEAGRLFVERAQAADDRFHLTDANAPAVAEICGRLDGRPLAIELAAAHVPSLPPAALAQRLEHSLSLLVGGRRDAPEHQQTVRGTIAWSYGLLSPTEQRLFRRLAVFVGGCTLEAAEAICSWSGTLGVEPLQGMEGLVRQSLLQPSQAPPDPAGSPFQVRFWMLETVREYALERLEESAELESLQRAHAAYFLRLAEESTPQVCGGSPRDWPARAERELGNLRAALEWAFARQETETAIGLAWALVHFWHWIGLESEGQRWGERAAALTEGKDLPPSLQIRARLARDLPRYFEISLQQGLELYAETLRQARSLGDRLLIALALEGLGNMAGASGDHAAARAYIEERYALQRELGVPSALAERLSDLATAVALPQGDLPEARRLLEQAIDLYRAVGNPLYASFTCGWLGYVLMHQGDDAQAHRLFEEALEAFRAARSRPNEAAIVLMLAELAIRRGDHAAARSHLREVLETAQEIGRQAWTERSLETSAYLAAAEGRAELAARRFGAAEAAREQRGKPLQPFMRAYYGARVDATRAALNQVAFARAWAAGRALTLEQALAYALETLEEPGSPA